MFDVGDDADDLAPGEVAAQSVDFEVDGDPLADRALGRPDLLGERLVDDDDPRRILDVPCTEVAPRNHRDTEGGEVARRGRAVVELPGLARLRLLALDEETGARVGAA